MIQIRKEHTTERGTLYGEHTESGECQVLSRLGWNLYVKDNRHDLSEQPIPEMFNRLS